MKIIIRDVVITVIIAVVIYLVIQNVFQTSVVVGPSMEPSFQDGQRLLINKAAYYLDEPERGDVIIFHPFAGQGSEYIKRIIGLPSDTIEVKTSAVYVNGTKLEETYVENPAAYTLTETNIPDSNYFVLGDNRNNSNDSHNGWTVPQQNITGKAWLSIWPPDQWGVVEDYPLEEQLASPAE